jgi:IS4 transposase
MTGNLEEVFKRFVEQRPVSVLARAAMERILSPQWVEAVFERSARTQYTRHLLFSALFELMVYVVLRVKPSVHAAYQALGPLGVEVKSVYNKLGHVEPATCAALVRESGREVAQLIAALGGRRQDWIPGYRVKVIDGNALAATERRLKELRRLAAGPLPGKTIVVYDPALDAVVDAFPCEDGHAQERSLLPQVLATLDAGDVQISDRNFCVGSFLWRTHARGAFSIVRHHAKLPLHELSALEKVGRADTGWVYEQFVETSVEGQRLVLRCIVLRLHKATRDGAWELRLLTDLPRGAATAQLIASLYARRWSIETAFQRLERDLHTELNTLGYPKAALFGFCVGLVAFNLMAVVYAALRAVHGEQKIDEEFSSYYLALELQGIREGMMVAIPEQSWRIYVEMPHPEVVAFFLDLAQKVNLARFKKHRRGAKLPQPPRTYDKSHPHVSTAKLLATRKQK